MMFGIQQLSAKCVLILACLLNGCHAQGEVYPRLTLAESKDIVRRIEALGGKVDLYQESDSGTANFPEAFVGHIRHVFLEGIDLSTRDLNQLMEHDTIDFLSLNGSILKKTQLRPLQKCPRLDQVELQASNTSDQHLKFLGQPPALRSLKLDRTPVSDRCVEYLDTLELLETLWFTDTKITREVATRLRKRFSGRFAFRWSTVPSHEILQALTELQRQGVNVYGSPTREELEKQNDPDQGYRYRFGFWDSWRYSPEVTRWLDTVASAEKIEIKVSCPAPELLQAIASLKTVYRLLLTEESKITDQGLATLEGIGSVERLVLHAPEVTDQGFAHVARLKGLKRISLSEMPLTESGLKNLSQSQELETVRFEHVKVSPEAFASLAGCKTLRTIIIYGDEVNDQSLKGIQKIPSLKELSMNNREDVSDEALKRLREQRPDLKVVKGSS